MKFSTPSHPDQRCQSKQGPLGLSACDGSKINDTKRHFTRHDRWINEIRQLLPGGNSSKLSRRNWQWFVCKKDRTLRVVRRYLPTLLIASSLFSLTATIKPGSARAEGSAQFGTNQPLIEYTSGTALYVDITNVGEVINTSICGLANSDDVQVQIFETIPNAVDPILVPTTSTSVFNQTLLNGNVSCTDPMTGTLATPLKYTTTKTGTYEIRLTNVTNASFNRFDVTVTPNISTPINPTTLQGRLYAYKWSFNTGSFNLASATDVNLFMKVPGGKTGENFVWQLDLNGFAGNVYSLVANRIGVNAPRSGLSTSTTGNTVSPEFPQYLSYPIVVGPRPTSLPLLSGFRFVDSAGVDNTISPGGTLGVQDSGTFSFTTDVNGVFIVVIDKNKDGIYGPGDVTLLKAAVPGLNSIIWNGKDNSGTVLPPGTYNAQVQVRIGEYHFIANDVETSGGGTNNGLTIYEARSQTILNSTNVFWDDQTLLSSLGGTTNLPIGALSSTPQGKHTWGDFSGSGIGDNTLIDTYAYGALSQATIPTIVATGDRAKLLIVKRITAIKDGVTGIVQSFNTFADDITSTTKTNDNHCNWPTATGTAGACTNTYTVGSINPGKVKPGDEIEYTIYYLNSGSYKATQARICDQLDGNLSFQTNFDATRVNTGIGLVQGNTAIQYLTNTGTDSDKGQLTTPALATSCNLGANAGTNLSSDVIVVDVGNVTSPLMGSTGAGTPITSYGYIRFKAKVK
jgi:uncharacterized repeat protein (TIGR01451 family)